MGSFNVFDICKNYLEKTKIEFWEKIIFTTDSIRFFIPDKPEYVPLKFKEIEYIHYSFRKTTFTHLKGRSYIGYRLLMEISYFNQKNNDFFTIYESLNKENALDVYDQIYTFSSDNYPVILSKPPRSRSSKMLFLVLVCILPVTGIILLFI